MSQMAKDLIHILPQITVLLTAVIALIFEMYRKPGAGLWSLGIGMLAAAGLSISRLGLDTTAFSDTFRIDAFNHWSVIILCPASVLFSLLVRSELKGTDREGTVYSLLAFSTLGSLLLAGSGDVMFLVLGILMNGLSGFALAAYPKTDKATEGAMKYFVYGSVTGAIMIFGLTYWVGITGSTLLSSLNNAGLQPFAIAFGFISLIVGIGYAASIFPFHFWTPDTFEGAPVSIAAYLSVIPKVGAIYGLAQVAKEIPVELINWPLILAVVAVFSMTFGNVVALWQQNVIRLLAYSTVAQAGYFLLGVVAMRQSMLAEQSLIIFGVAYAVMNIGAFAVVQARGTRLEAYNGIGKLVPWTSVAMTVFLFSLVGMPPLAGFAGKFLLFGAAIDSQFTWLAIAAIFNSVISLAVYIRIIFPMFYKKPTVEPLPASSLVHWVWIICLCVTVVAGIGVQWLL